jgi:hypothetical protein
MAQKAPKPLTLKEWLAGQRRGKYNAKPVVVDGVRYQSTAEAKRHGELKLLERGRGISKLTRQPKFVLQEAFTRDGKKYRAVTYTADFRYIEKGRVVVEDVKGEQTKEFRDKWKMFIYQNPNIDARILKV